MFTEPSFPGILIFVILLAALTIVFISASVRAFASRKPGWVVSAIIPGVFLAGLLGYAALRIAGNSINQNQLSRDSRVFESEDGLSAITAPLSWKKISIGPTDASLKVGNSAAREYLVVISELKSDFPKGYTIRNYAAAATQSISNALTEVEATDFADFRLNGMKALRCEISGYSREDAMDYFTTFGEGKEHFHQIRGWTSRDNRTTAFPLFRQVSDTFHELPR